ncbi:Uncharacterised protein [Burkholderia pseudomallei]|nr:Uncharacterised protein [Burkholderia pseudomallei]CAJ3411297.1 Uncharacterised protein [Burkholderia pseudomallei]CAJ3456802.1 Uncharacterised protein [Burkholderia pseudomallei]CAJ3520355.1 Uncharacterised protein [Burkholderia pseudomallei]CAJ3938229.1 Uncharacterised protein [Burkholderia pseudomallei]
MESGDRGDSVSRRRREESAGRRRRARAFAASLVRLRPSRARRGVRQIAAPKTGARCSSAAMRRRLAFPDAFRGFRGKRRAARRARNSSVRRYRAARLPVVANSRGSSDARGAARSSGPESMRIGRRASASSRSSRHSRAGAAVRGGARAEAAEAAARGGPDTAAARDGAAPARGGPANDRGGEDGGPGGCCVAEPRPKPRPASEAPTNDSLRRKWRQFMVLQSGELEAARADRAPRFDANAPRAGYRYESCNGRHGTPQPGGTRALQEFMGSVRR